MSAPSPFSISFECLGHTVLSGLPKDLFRIIDGPLRGYWFYEDGRHQEYLGGRYEHYVQSSLPCLQTGDTFYDVGAHYGFHTLLGAHLVGETGKVYAFEPNSTSRRYLEQNIAVNNFTERVVISGRTVSDHNNTEVFFVTKEATDLSSTIDLREQWNTAGVESEAIEISSIRLDTFANGPRIDRTGFKPPRLIKIDVEGSESRVLRGAENTIRAFKPAIILSTHGVEQTQVCDQILRNLEYTSFPINGPEVVLALPLEQRGETTGHCLGFK